jgi:hypothetical protein
MLQQLPAHVLEQMARACLLQQPHPFFGLCRGTRDALLTQVGTLYSLASVLDDFVW